MLNSVPFFILEGIDKLKKITPMKAFAHHYISPKDVVIAIQTATLATEGFGLIGPNN